MWTEIDTHISQATGTKFKTVTKRSISGGCINQGYAVSNGQHTYFVKINQASYITMFSAEALGLQQMYDTHTIRVPKPLCWGSAGNQSYIVMEWLDIGSGNNSSWEKMGRHLAAMHKVRQNRFGWDMNNTIGSTTQINTWTDSWVEFYTEHRLGYQFKLGRRKGGHFTASEELLAAIPELLAGHEVYPSLVHGDLWGGNAGCTNDGTPVIFDPATYYGDREVDIAMTELFGGFSPAFYQGYNEVFPLDSGYEKRKVLYNLYHIVNHFNLFGGSYESQANRMISQILR
jgi:fructosamine-3-kinase